MATEFVDPMSVGDTDERTQLETFVDSYRQLVDASLDGLTEEEARRRLVPSKTTLLGLMKHVIFMQTVWFTEAVIGTPRQELGMPMTPDESFDLTQADTIESIRADYRATCETSRRNVADRSLDDVVTGHRLGRLTLRWVYLQSLRELAHHCGHADILRAQILASRD